MDHVARFAQTSRCREGGLHEANEVHDVFDEQVAHICVKCLDRVMPILNTRAVSGWPARSTFYVEYEEAGVP